MCLIFSKKSLRVLDWPCAYKKMSVMVGEKNPSCAYNANCLKELSVVMNSFKKSLDFFSFRSITYAMILII